MTKPQKFKTIETAEEFAREQSKHFDDDFFVIEDHQQKTFYVDTDSLCRNFETRHCYYQLGKKCGI